MAAVGTVTRSFGSKMAAGASHLHTHARNATESKEQPVCQPRPFHVGGGELRVVCHGLAFGPLACLRGWRPTSARAPSGVPVARPRSVA